MSSEEANIFSQMEQAYIKVSRMAPETARNLVDAMKKAWAPLSEDQRLQVAQSVLKQLDPHFKPPVKSAAPQVELHIEAVNAPAVSLPLVTRFAGALDGVVRAIQDAIAFALKDPGLAGGSGLVMWQMDALPVLLKKQEAVQAAVERFKAGEARPILELADEMVHLSKNLDGFPEDFAGPSHKTIIDSRETLLVQVAYYLRASAGLP